MKPAQVLDEMVTLKEYLRTRDYRAFMQEYLGSVAAVQSRLPITGANLFPTVGADWCDKEIRTLEMAHAFHVAAEMEPLIKSATRGLDEDFTWTKEVFPTEAGFMVFDEPISTVDIRNEVQRIAAATWHWGSHDDGHAGCWWTFYSRWDDPKDETSVRMIKEQGYRGMQLLGNLQTSHVEFIRWGSRVGPPGVSVDEDDVAFYAELDKRRARDRNNMEIPVVTTTSAFEPPTRIMWATLALMGQTITDVSEQEAGRSQRKRLGKKRLPPRVVVIRLRRIDRGPSNGESHVEWSHRWAVRGHWRKQPCGPGRSDISVIWISAHIKGPEGKPLLISSKVYDLRR